MDLKELVLKAKNKDVNAMHVLAMLYLKGEKGVSQDISQAYQLLENSANLGKIISLYELAKIHMKKEYNLYDIPKAIKLLSQSSKSGHTLSSFELGLIYYKGIEIPVDYEKAEENLRRAAINPTDSVKEAQMIMANIYENGLLFNDVDLMETYRFYLLAANKGDALAQFKVGNFLIKGIEGYLEKNTEEGITYLKKASESGNSQASVFLAKFFLEEAINLLQKSSLEDKDINYVLNHLKSINIDLL